MTPFPQALRIFQRLRGSVRMLCARLAKVKHVSILWGAHTLSFPCCPMAVLPALCSFGLHVHGQPLCLRPVVVYHRCMATLSSSRGLRNAFVSTQMTCQ